MAQIKLMNKIAAVGIIAVLFCTLSMCRRKEPDYYFYYVGPGEFTSNQQRAIINSLGEKSGEDGRDATRRLSSPRSECLTIILCSIQSVPFGDSRCQNTSPIVIWRT